MVRVIDQQLDKALRLLEAPALPGMAPGASLRPEPSMKSPASRSVDGNGRATAPAEIGKDVGRMNARGEGLAIRKGRSYEAYGETR